MGTVISLPEPALDLMLYSNKGNIISNYIVNQLQQIKPSFNEFSNRIYQSLQNSYNFINDKLTYYGLMNQLSNAGVNAIDNYFTELTSFNALQNANITMQRWIMSHPEVRKLYLNQDIDGYSNSYNNIFGKDIGDKDYNYRLATDGVIFSTDDYWYVKHYLDDLLPGDKELDHYEKVQILTTYDAIDYILKTCNFDFTVKSETPIRRNN